MLSDKIQQQALQYLKDETKCENWKFSGKVVSARQCTVYQICCPDFHCAIALKKYRNKEASRQLRGQYRALERFSASLNKTNSSYHTPEPYGCFVEDEYFLMEWVSGLSLDHILWRSFYHAKKQQAAIRQAFLWLKHYHQQADLIEKEVDINYYSKRLQKHIEQYKGQDLIKATPIFIEAMEMLKKLSTEFTNYLVEHADAHGDFTPTNIMLDKEQATAIDIGSGHKQAVENDMALLLNYITIDFINMLPRRTMRKPTNTWTILNITLEAYGYPQDEKRRRFFLYVFLYQTLRRWLIINDRNIKKSRWLDKWRLRNSEIIVAGLLGKLSK